MRASSCSLGTIAACVLGSHAAGRRSQACTAILCFRFGNGSLPPLHRNCNRCARAAERNEERHPPRSTSCTPAANPQHSATPSACPPSASILSRLSSRRSAFLKSTARWPPRADLPVGDGELATAVVLGFELLEVCCKGLLDEASHRVLIRPSVEHRHGVLHAQ
jgi:hypothetical protein